MNLEKYTERVRGFIQSAESLARREGHQQFTPEQILKVLLEDDQGLASGLIEGFVSKRGSNFSAYLTLAKDKKKAEFEFPPR